MLQFQIEPGLTNPFGQTSGFNMAMIRKLNFERLTRKMKGNFYLDPSESTEENFERFTEAFSHHRIDWPADEVAKCISTTRGYWAKLTEEEKWKFLEVCKERQAKVGMIVDAGHPFRKATDAQLQLATKFIDQSNITGLATRYLGLTSQEIEGRDVFSVLKLWRDSMPFQGSKEVGMPAFPL